MTGHRLPLASGHGMYRLMAWSFRIFDTYTTQEFNFAGRSERKLREPYRGICDTRRVT
jgi:hypothetical protein